jgi:hypothetical protein
MSDEGVQDDNKNDPPHVDEGSSDLSIEDIAAFSFPVSRPGRRSGSDFVPYTWEEYNKAFDVFLAETPVTVCGISFMKEVQKVSPSPSQMLLLWFRIVSCSLFLILPLFL